MTAKDAIRHTVEFCRQVTTEYLKDLSDADLLVRPVENANHIAWQLGHLINSEREMMASLGHPTPSLPDGFAEKHGREAARSNRAADFLKRQEYVALMEQVRRSTLAALERTAEADLDRAPPESMRSYAPTVAAVYTMIGTHELMHAGQFVPVRRKLGKPILF